MQPYLMAWRLKDLPEHSHRYLDPPEALQFSLASAPLRCATTNPRALLDEVICHLLREFFNLTYITRFNRGHYIFCAMLTCHLYLLSVAVLPSCFKAFIISSREPNISSVILRKSITCCNALISCWPSMRFGAHTKFSGPNIGSMPYFSKEFGPQ